MVSRILAHRNFHLFSQIAMVLITTSKTDIFVSTPIVTGAIALLLQKYPDLCPDDVKYMLKKSATNLNYPPNQQGWGLLNIDKLISGEAHYVRK